MKKFKNKKFALLLSLLTLISGKIASNTYAIDNRSELISPKKSNAKIGAKILLIGGFFAVAGITFFKLFDDSPYDKKPKQELLKEDVKKALEREQGFINYLR